MSRKPAILAYEQEGEDPSRAKMALREVFFRETGFTKVPVYRRKKLGHGNRIAGPSLVEADDHTIVIPPGFDGFVDQYRSIILRARR